MTEDEDIDAPTIEELKTLATLLWDFYPRTRLKGKKGEALRELSEIRDQIDNGSLSATETVRLGNRLWALNGTSFSGPGPLGVGQFVWRPNHRSKGAPSKTVDAELDYRLIQYAKDLTISKARAVRDAAKAEPEKFGKLQAGMDRTGRVDGPFKRLKVMRQATAICAEQPPLPERGPYRVLVAEPPWP